MKIQILLIALILAVTTANAKKVKFSVDMTGLPVNTTGVHVSGDFQDEAGFEGGDWQSNTTEMLSQDGSAIYSVVVDIPAFAKYEYKFINGDQWYEVEFVPLESRVGYDFNDNRWVYVDSLYNDTTLIPAVLFSGNAPAGHYLLRLKVDLSLEDMIDPAGVHVALDFQNMDPASTKLYSFGEDVYEQIVYVEILTGYAHCSYFFVNGCTEAGFEVVPVECAFDLYRYIEIPEDTIAETVCFSECVSCDAIGIPEVLQDHGAIIFPNPCRELATVEFNDADSVHQVTVTDLLGNTMRIYKDCHTKTITLSTDELPAGIYFVRIETGNRWLSTLRLVISDN